jgi:hypothetical protein
MLTHRRCIKDKAFFAILVSIGALSAACADGGPTAPPSLERFSAPSAQVLNSGRPQPTFSFTPIDVPGALATSPQGINAGGVIAGTYRSAEGRVHGFILEDGIFTTVDRPGADNTEVRGIGPSGEVVGDSWNVGEEGTAAHGFRRTADGGFAPVHFPGHLYEFPQRILPDGTILGCRHDHDLMASMRGIRIARDDSSEVDAFASMTNGATPDGQLVVGLYTNMSANNRQEGFVIDRGTFAALLVANSTLTAAWDVNPRGEIVGVYRNGAGVHGFVMTPDGVTPVNYPGAFATRAFGINARGDLIGTYQLVAGGPARGFVATRTR